MDSSCHPCEILKFGNDAGVVAVCVLNWITVSAAFYRTRAAFSMNDITNDIQDAIDILGAKLKKR